MKRINVFMEEETQEKLNEIVKTLKNGTILNYSWYHITKSDLVRYALSKTFGISFFHSHLPIEKLDLAMSALNKKTKQKTKGGK